MRKPIFPPSFWQDLAASNPLGLLDVTEQDARDWFEMIWPVYQQHRAGTRTPNHKLKVANFWIRIGERELERARAFGAERRRGAQVAQLTEIASQAFPDPNPAPRRDLPSLKIAWGMSDG